MAFYQEMRLHAKCPELLSGLGVVSAPARHTRCCVAVPFQLSVQTTPLYMTVLYSNVTPPHRFMPFRDRVMRRNYLLDVHIMHINLWLLHSKLVVVALRWHDTEWEGGTRFSAETAVLVLF